MAKEIKKLEEGRKRVIIEGVAPEIDGGRFPIKRTIGESVCVEADIFADGHDVLSACLKYRTDSVPEWKEIALEPLVNDRWRGTFDVVELGEAVYTVEGWVDPFKTWRRNLEKKFRAQQEIDVEILGGVPLLKSAARRASGADAKELETAAQSLLKETSLPLRAKVAVALSPRIAELMNSYGDRPNGTRYHRELRVTVDPVIARFGAWYEMFPRSCSPEPGRHGTFQDCEALLPRIAALGFDVLYLPPIHPIGRAFRKGQNNRPEAEPGEPGSPWGIGAEEGGHKSIHPELGTLAEFRRLVERASALKLQVALDIAFQCAPDHPYVRKHPEWFRKRPDGTIQYAENPPKKYQDIYPIDFETEDWPALWTELRSIFEYWIEQGVTIFRVDNPHTKAFPFWEWCIGELKRARPELVFLAEAFTRPKVMYYLAKLGFTQSYNYFPWRNTRHELTEFMTELTRTGVREFFRPNLWPNTPDILTEYLQFGGRPAFMTRLVLAATLGASYGIYGPAFELCENQPREVGSEEYLNSEKYEIRAWNRTAPESLADLIQRLNVIRRENPALHQDATLEFHRTDNEQLLAYSKATPGFENVILTVVNLDPHHMQSGWLNLPLEEWDLDPHDTYQMQDLLSGAHFIWSGSRNYVELSPTFLPAHVFRLRRRVRTEHDFDYFF